MQEHASLVVLLETKMHLRYGYVKLRQKFTFIQCKQQSLISEKRVVPKKKKKFTEHLNNYPTNIRHTMTAW